MVRLSGNQALPIALRHLSVSGLEPRRATFTKILSDKGLFVDEGIAILYPAPHSYTGETTVEVSCHGSLYVQQSLIDMFVGGGARLAEPGEFTMRAFLNGKLNLSQAEAVADLIDAVSPAQHRLAVSQLRGGYARKLTDLRARLLDLTSLLELELDFSQEDVEFADRHELQRIIRHIIRETDSLLASFERGDAIRRGVPVAIVGAPNVGKSTLLNALLEEERAIVSPQAGTTRDTVEETMIIDGVLFRLIDTAGLRHAEDDIERQGIERTRTAIGQAMVVVEVCDASSPGNCQPAVVCRPEQTLIRVFNKCDLSPASVKPAAVSDASARVVCTSALRCEGIDELKSAIADSVSSRGKQEMMLVNSRHKEALLRVSQSLKVAADGIDSHLPADLVAVDLRDALYHLGTITGEVTSDELLGNIFSRFCIGK